MPKLTLDGLLSTGVDQETAEAILELQEKGTPKPRWRKIQVTEAEEAEIQEAFPELVFKSLYTPRKSSE